MNPSHIRKLAFASAFALVAGAAGAQQQRGPERAAAAAGIELPAQDHSYQLGGVAGMTEQDRPFITGGVSIEEAYSLEAVRDNYRLWLVTAAEPSGAWLAGAEATIRDDRGDTVLQTTLEGPYLLVDLAPGRYQVTAEYEDQSQTHAVTVGERGTRQLIAYFDAAAKVSPDMPDRQIAPVGAEPLIELNTPSAG